MPADRYSGIRIDREGSETVFLFPFWEEIYARDTEREQDKKEARDMYHVMKNIYEEFGYETVTALCLPAEERARWIRERIGGCESTVG